MVRCASATAHAILPTAAAWFWSASCFDRLGLAGWIDTRTGKEKGFFLPTVADGRGVGSSCCSTAAA